MRRLLVKGQVLFIGEFLVTIHTVKYEFVIDFDDFRRLKNGLSRLRSYGLGLDVIKQPLDVLNTDKIWLCLQDRVKIAEC